MIYAVVFMPPGTPAAETLILQCITHVEEHGYELRSILDDWEQVVNVLHEGLAHVVVLARREHLPTERLPRIEVVGHHPGDGRPALNERPGRAGYGRRPRVVN